MTEIICPCDEVVHPRVIANPPGLDTFDYRIGDFASFRQALLRPRDGELALRDWQPNTEGDLTAQLLEWWAYLADVLVFYNERALHENLLRTAAFPDDVRRIIRLLGYRPRPGIAATGLVAAILDTPRPFLIPQGFAIQATIPDNPPQVFEVDEDIEAGLLGKPLRASAGFPTLKGQTQTSPWMGYAMRDEQGRIPNKTPARAKREKKMPVCEAGTQVKLAVDGTLSNVQRDDVLLLMRKNWVGSALDQLAGTALASVAELEHKQDELGRAITLLTLNLGQTLPVLGDLLGDFRLLKSTKYAHLWLYHDRYPGTKTPSPAGTFLQIVETIFDPGGLFTGGISREPPQDPHSLTSVQMELPAEGAAHLEAICRGIKPGDPVLIQQKLPFPGLPGIPFELPGLFAKMVEAGTNNLAPLSNALESFFAFVVKVAGYSELVWYANPPELDRIGQGPPIGPPSHGLISGGAAPIPIPHSKITFRDPLLRASIMSADDTMIRTVLVHYAWEDVGELVPTPEQGGTPDVEVPGSEFVPKDAKVQVVIEDITGAGVPGWIGVDSTTSGQPPLPPLVGALNALMNLLPVSRGQTVTDEVIGSGESILVNQELALGQFPLTYLADTGPQSMHGYRSTLRVRVDGIEWHEVPSFFEQPPDARVFVTREDDQQRTYVRFGDGEFGARLPTGKDNVVASYRFGSGRATPPVGSLTTIMKPREGLQQIRNPIVPSGGDDPDPPEQIKRYAPRSVLAFDRAISGTDYETIAAQTPGVRRAKVRWGWDAAAQRSMVKVYVGDDDAAVKNARDALRRFSDPNRPVLVTLASPIQIDLTLTLEVHADYDTGMVKANVASALLDPLSQPFGVDVVKIDEVLYDSEIYDACLKVPGVIAVHGLQLRTQNLDTYSLIPLTPQPAGFKKQFGVWGFFPKIPLLPFLLPASDEIKIEFAKPLLQPLPKTLRDRVDAAAVKWNARNDAAARPPQPTTPASEIWNIDRGERHAPGEGRFYLLQADRLHISTEVWRHGR